MELVKPIFVPDDGDPNSMIGELLVRRSRSFEFEEANITPSLSTFEESLGVAQAWIGAIQSELVIEHREKAAQSEEVELHRIERLFENRLQAAQDKIESCRKTYERIIADPDPQVRQAAPLWTSRLDRATTEYEMVGQDRIMSLKMLNDRKNLTAEHRLLNIARIEVDN